MHDGMQYDPIQGHGHGQGHEPSSPIYNGGWQMTADS